MKTIRQHDRNDCGAACLAGIASHYGKPLTVAHVKLLAGTSGSGTNLADLRHAALRLGFQAEAVSGDIAGLSRSPLPAIVHLDHVETGSHFVVLVRMDSRTASVLDPADGRRYRWPIARLTAYWSGAALLLLPGPGFLVDGSNPASIRRRIFQLLLPYRRPFAKAFMLALAASALALAGACFVWIFTDRILPENRLENLHTVGALFALALSLQVAMSAIRKHVTLRTARLIDNRLLRGYYRHIVGLAQSVHNQLQPGELLSRMGDAMHIRRFVNDLLIQSGVPMLALATVLFAALASRPVLGLWLLASVAGHAAIYALFSALYGPIQRKLMARDAALDAQFTETLGAIATVKQLGLERLHGHKLDARIHDFLESGHTSGRLGLWSEEATSLLAKGFSLALLWAGGASVLGGGLTLGELLAFYTLGGHFSAAAAQLMPLAGHAQEARIAAERMYALLDLPTATRAGATQLQPERILPVVAKGIHFAYRRGAEVLHDLSMDITRGTITVIRGDSGSGKSTLFALLLRQYPVTAGRIHLGIHPLELVSMETLSRQIAIVPQRVQLFDDTLAANICPWATPDPKRLATLCHELGLFDLVDSLPLQLDTPIGPDGCLLSGGQRQLVAMARALYREPQLLLLDEATSALDAESESRVHRVLLRERDRGTAVVWASHRERSERIADRVWLLHAGRLTVQNNRPPYHPTIPHGNAATVLPNPGVAAAPGNVNLNGHETHR